MLKLVYTVALLRDSNVVWRLKSKEVEEIYNEHPSVLKYTDVRAPDGWTAADLANFSGHSEGKRVVKLLNGHKNVDVSYDLTKEQVIEALELNDNLYVEAAKSLGMNKNTFRRYMKKHRIKLIKKKREL